MIYGQHVYNCELDDIEVYFEYGDSVVFSTGEKEIGYTEIGKIKCSKLSVVSKGCIEQYQGPMEVNRYFRRENLVIQGIISFFTGVPLTVYHSNSSSSGLNPIDFKKQDTRLVIKGTDYTNDLKVLLKKLNEETELIITLLDRWRKAIYLKLESYDADLYYDEAILSFFHILELFGDTVNKELRIKVSA